ncbi:MAG: hypothetical protein B7733_04510 [Myxococcales bacterium FL481]|nr:MAG: hypothetical protein B7733_04510 [Myxococcales bacterium FL481]
MMPANTRAPRWSILLAAAALLGAGACRQQPSGADDSSRARGDAPPATEDAKASKQASQKRKKDRKRKKKRRHRDKRKSEAPLPPLDDGPIAVVAGQPVPNDVFKALLQLQLDAILRRRDDGKVPNPAQRHYRKSIAQRLVWEALLQQETLASGVEYDKAELEAYLARTTYADSAEFLSRSLETKRSWEAKAVAYYRERAHLRKRVALEATDAEISAFYAENKTHFDSPEERAWAAHVLVAIGPRQSPGDKIIEPSRQQREAASAQELAKWDEMALAKAKRLRKALLASKRDFMDFAREHSEGPGAFRGGDMGVFDRKRMIGEYSDVVFSMPVGEVSQPFKTEKGYFIVKLFGRWPGGVLPQEALVGELRRNIEERKYREAKKALQNELYRKFPVQNRIFEALGETDDRREAAFKEPSAPAELRPDDGAGTTAKPSVDPVPEGAEGSTSSGAAKDAAKPTPTAKSGSAKKAPH